MQSKNEDIERELAEAGQLKEYTKEEQDTMLEKLIGEIEEISRKIDTNLRKQIKRMGEKVLRTEMGKRVGSATARCRNIEQTP